MDAVPLKIPLILCPPWTTLRIDVSILSLKAIMRIRTKSTQKLCMMGSRFAAFIITKGIVHHKERSDWAHE
eukprot:9403626-Ditylum_brightwellii.AAC.1